MSKDISIKNGAKLNLKGCASKEFGVAKKSLTYALNPDDFFSLIPRMLVKEGDKVFSEENGNVGGAEGLAVVPKGQEDAVVESAEECPGECIMIEP